MTATNDSGVPTPITNTSMGPPRGADLLVDALVGAKISTIFGVPGDTGVVFYDALYTNADRIQHVLMRDERHAAKAADAYARVSGRIGAVEVSSGGGTTFVVGGLGEAYASGIPVLLITSDIHSSSVGTGALTEIDQTALFSAVTKWQARVRTAAELPAAVAEAVRVATTGRPAPVAIIVPEDVLDEQVEAPVDIEQIDPSVPAQRLGCDPEQVAEAAEALSRAERAVILAGSGVHQSGAYVELADLAELLGAAVATTIHGRGVIPDSSPWAVGSVGNNGERPGTNAFLADADAFLLVGTRANATDTNSWSLPPRDGSVAIIQIDIDPRRAGRNFPDAIGLPGDAKTVLGQLVEALAGHEAEGREARREAIALLAKGWREELGEIGAARERLTELAPDHLLPEDVVRTIHSEMGADTVVLADPGTPTPNANVFWEIDRPARSVIIPRGHGPMGYAIPAAVGTCFAKPGQRVVSLTADGSFAMACGELETVARYDLPILYVQLTNNSMGWIKMLQHLYTGGRYFGVDPGPIDSAAVARACGLTGVMVTSLAQFRQAVEDFATDPKPTYLDVQVPHMIDYQPPVPAWHPAEDGTHERPVY